MEKILQELLEVNYNFTMVINYNHSCEQRKVKPTKAGYWTYCAQNGMDMFPEFT